jgi:hypothetical protein
MGGRAPLQDYIIYMHFFTVPKDRGRELKFGPFYYITTIYTLFYNTEFQHFQAQIFIK